MSGNLLPDDSRLDLIRRILPGLQITSARRGEDGLVNDVVVVNDEWVFRFARDEQSRQTLWRELRTLTALEGRITLRIPRVEHHDKDWFAYRFIPGVPLTRGRLESARPATRERVMTQLACFLSELHASLQDSSSSRLVVDSATARAACERLYASLELELFPYMMAHSRESAIELFRPAFEGRVDLGYVAAFLHGDLMPYHLCYDPDQKRLNGVIDFGDAGWGDPATDIASLLLGLGESMVSLMQAAYPDLPSLMQRARFHARTLELRWSLQAVRTRSPAWFLCHLGYARDLMPPLTPSSASPSA